MDTKLKKCCPNCSQFFQVTASRSRSTSSVPNVPLFLACGHSMCENCIRSIVKFGEPIECKVCLQSMHPTTADMLLMHDKATFYNVFPVNFAMVGEITFQDMEAKKDTASPSYFIDVKTLIKTTDALQGECAQCHGPTSKMCVQCGGILCQSCFIKIHKNVVFFKNHVLQDIAIEQQKVACKVHQDKPLDYYCKTCSKTICMDCMVLSGDKFCKNHDVTTVQEMNQQFSPEIENLSPKVEETLRRLAKTNVDIGNLLTKIDNQEKSSQYNALLNDVEHHFSKIHAAIQKQKDAVTSKLVALKAEEKESLKEAQNYIAEGIKKTATILNTLSSLDLKNTKEFNLAALIEDIKEIIDTKWYLNRDESENSLNVTVKDELYSLLPEFIKLEGESNPKYELHNTKTLTEKNMEIPAPPASIVYPPEVTIADVRQKNKNTNKEEPVKPQVFFKEVPKYRSNKSGSCTSLNSNNSDTSNKSFFEQQRSQTESMVPLRHLYEGSQELIYVSHIVDPHNMFVQRVCQQGQVQELIREFRNAVSQPKPSPNHVAEGKMYLVHNKADNLWQRCRVVSVDRRDENKLLIHVFCVDFGSTEVVTIDKLRLLHQARIKSPEPLAINCRLANCEPIHGSWTQDDSFLVQKIIDNKRAVIHIRKLKPSQLGAISLECDITTFDDGVSLAHALAFHGRAIIPKNLSYPKMMMGATEKPKLFMNNSDYKRNTVEEVVITYIVNPDNFHVRKKHNQALFEKLCEDLDQEYSMAVNKECVYLPEKGMVCVVNVSKCTLGAEIPGEWARAVVVERPGRERARVLLPDTGEPVYVHWSALRRIRPKFTTLKALATQCHLAGVTPTNKKWSPASVMLLEKFKDRCLELHVEESHIHGSIGVSLYDKSGEEPVSVNVEMIKYRYAIAIGIYNFNRNSELANIVYNNKCPLDTPKPRHKPKNKDEITILKRPTETSRQSEDLEAKDKGPLRIEAKILNFQSPSVIYVSLVHQQKVFNELFEKLQKYYSTNKTQGKDDWKVEDRCCTLCAQSETWRRAVIVEINGEKAKVFYSDFALVDTVSVSSLREMPAEFSALGDAAIVCHMHGVIPAGDEWPSLTKEYVKDLLDTYQRIFITKLGDFKGKSMPVQLWVYHTIEGSALEPDISEWRCINKMIVEQGLGVPDKSEEPAGGAPENTGELSFLNVKGSVSDWLQMEPMPMKPLAIPPQPEDDSRPSTSADVDEHGEEGPQSSNAVFITDWLPPEPLKCDEFTAVPTYVSDDGVIYLHDIKQQETLDIIRNSLEVRFNAPDPKTKFVKWNVGEPCIARFYLDDQLYRGKVLEVYPEKSSCLILYVDYGNEDMCSFENLRKGVTLYNIPIQAHKCVLNRIIPAGKKWSRRAVDYIHKLIVDRQCYVKVSGKPIDDVTPIELKYNKITLSDHLVELELATYSDGTKAVVHLFAPTHSKYNTKENTEEHVESDSGPDYIIESDDYEKSSSESQVSIRLKCDLEGKDWNELMQEDEKEDGKEDGRFVSFSPFTETEFLCNVNIVNEKDKLELRIVHDHETAAAYEEMYAQLQTENDPPLDGVYENKACLALFPDDGRWYRAKILQYDEAKSLVKVKYVDYGNVAVVPLGNVREINEEHLKLPPATITATLNGVMVNPDLEVKTIVEKISGTFLDKDDPFHAKVIQANATPSVELRDINGKLIYDSLIEEKVFLKCD